jgi:hypothetical protein
MELKEIASIAGKGGLYRIVKPTRSGVIVESIDDKKQRLVVNANQRVSVLKEISIYTNTAEGTEPLQRIFEKIHSEFGDDPGIDSNSSPEELKAFLQHILPDYDRERVYPSDIKKLVSWYKILLENAPETLQESKEEAPAAEKEESPAAEQSDKAEEPEKKEKKAKTAKAEKEEK